MSSCIQDKITGGTVTVGTHLSEVRAGKVRRTKVPCDVKMRHACRQHLARRGPPSQRHRPAFTVLPRWSSSRRLASCGSSARTNPANVSWWMSLVGSSCGDGSMTLPAGARRLPLAAAIAPCSARRPWCSRSIRTPSQASNRMSAAALLATEELMERPDASTHFSLRASHDSRSGCSRSKRSSAQAENTQSA